MKWNVLKVRKERGLLVFMLMASSLLYSSFLFVGEPRAQYGSVGLVGESEAVAIADLWMRMELNSGCMKMEESERLERLGHLEHRQVSYLVSKNDVRNTFPEDANIWAYIVTYEPSGFVIVAGTDRIEPIIAFDTQSKFWWDRPEPNTLRDFLNDTIERHWEDVPSNINSNWTHLRSQLSQGKSVFETHYGVFETAVDVHWETALWGQGWPYNEVVAQNNGNKPNVLTGCTNTAWAIKLRFHEWPLTGNGQHGYSDTEGDVQFQHFANFGAQTYHWENMPIGILTASNLDVATLMYHCGIVTETNYEEGFARAPRREHEIEYHFRYKGTEYIFDTTGVQHQVPIIASIRGGLPVLVASHSHTMVLDGYRDTVAPFWHVNGGNSGPGDPDAFWWNTLLDVDIYNSWPYCSPDNYVYVDVNWTGTENGYIQTPYNTLSEGLSAVPTNGHLWLKEGIYNDAPITFDRAMTIRGYEGTAVIRTP